jgi:3-(3-hydroxy-phenyl)propionate hydroxylase
VSWKVGKVFFRDDWSTSFDLLPEAGHQMPAMINLQQYHLEEMLVAKPARSSRPASTCAGSTGCCRCSSSADHALLRSRRPTASSAEADWVIACDGANSDTRRMVGAEFTGQFFQDRFLIADVVMKADFPTERWFWFDPPFHRGQSVLLHKQADNVWRIDFQLGWDADPDEAKKPENVMPRIRAMLGPDADFELEWVRSTSSPAGASTASATAACCLPATRRTRCRPSARAAPTPACRTSTTWPGSWRWCCRRRRPSRCSTATTTSAPGGRRQPAQQHPLDRLHHAQERRQPRCARRGAGTGQDRGLCAPAGQQRPPVDTHALRPLGLNTPDTEAFAGRMAPGTACADAPVRVDGRDDWLLHALGRGFTLLAFGDEAARRAVSASAVSPPAAGGGP